MQAIKMYTVLFCLMVMIFSGCTIGESHETAEPTTAPAPDPTAVPTQVSTIVPTPESTIEPTPLPTPPEPVTFTKEDYADPTLPENQDRITDIVRITRGDIQGPYNAYSEMGYSSTSPADTGWALGATFTHTGPSDYSSWVVAIESDPQGHLNEAISLYLITDDLYFDVVFTSFTGGNQGGGFSYTRLQADPPGSKR